MSTPPTEPSWRRLAPWTSVTSLDEWLRRTMWWTSQDAWPRLGSPTGLASSRRVLIELLEAMSGRFVGRVIEVDVGQHRVSFVLERIEVEQPDAADPAATSAPRGDWTAAHAGVGVASDWLTMLPGRRMSEWWGGRDPLAEPDRIRLEARDVVVGDAPLGRVTAVVANPRVEAGRQPCVVTGPIDLVAVVDRPTITNWIGRSLEGWTVRARPDGFVDVARGRRRFTAVVSATPAGRDVEIRVRSVAVFGREFRIPRRVVLRRRVAIPAPPRPLEFVSADEVGDRVEIRFVHPGLRYPIRLDRLRELTRAGASRLRLPPAADVD